MNITEVRNIIRQAITEVKAEKKEKANGLPKSGGKLVHLKKELAGLKNMKESLSQYTINEGGTEPFVAEYAHMQKFVNELEKIKTAHSKLAEMLDNQISEVEGKITSETEKIKEMVGLIEKAPKAEKKAEPKAEKKTEPKANKEDSKKKLKENNSELTDEESDARLDFKDEVKNTVKSLLDEYNEDIYVEGVVEEALKIFTYEKYKDNLEKLNQDLERFVDDSVQEFRDEKDWNSGSLGSRGLSWRDFIKEATKERGDKGRQHSSKSKDYGEEYNYTPKTDYRVNQKFHHKKYGTGVITKVEPVSPVTQAKEGAKIYVRFSDGNNKIMSVKTLKPEMRENQIEEKKKPSAGMTKKEKSTVIKKARAGKDIGKKGKGFEKVAAAAGGGKKGQAIAAAQMWKSQAKK